MAGKLGLGPSKLLSKEETIEQIPNIEPDDLKGGVIYYDGQFDDSRLAINLAQTVADQSGTVLNYMKVINLLKNNGMTSGLVAIDQETQKEYKINARVVVNATGIFTDNILKLDNPKANDMIALSQGVHIILDKEFLQGDSAIMVPHTDDGRVLFAVPWHNKVIVGTTDTNINEAVLEPIPLEEEIDFILKHTKKYMHKDPSRDDIKSVFAGIRPLVKPAEDKGTAAISRDHFLVVSESGLVTITGGKWTTYRKMGEDTINHAAWIAGLVEKPSVTRTLRIHGWLKNIDISDPKYVYGSDIEAIKKLEKENKSNSELLSEKFSITNAEVLWHIRNEMARTVEDVLSRRTRVLLFDAKESIKIAPKVAKILASELKRSRKWQKEQVENYSKLAEKYILI